MSPDAAKALLTNSDLKAALAAFEQTLLRKPDDVVALAGYASLLRRVGRVEESLQQWRKAREFAPDDAALCFNHANALRAAGQLAAAEQSYQRALQLVPSLLPAGINLGLLYQDQNRFNEAEQAYAAVLKFDPTQLTAAMNRGNCLRQLGRLVEAIEQQQRAAALAPNSAEARYNLGNALRSATRINEAIAAYRAALTAGPAALKLWTQLGVNLQDLGDSEAALLAFDRARREHPNAAQAHCNFGHMAMRLRRPREGIESLRLALRLEPGEPIATSHLVDALIKTGFLSEAIDLAAAALQQALASIAADPTQDNLNDRLARLHNVLGNAHLRAGDVDQAITHLTAAKQLAPDARSISNFLFASLYREDIDALQKAALHQQECKNLGNFPSVQSRAVGANEDRSCTEELAPTQAPLTATSIDGRRLRVGYISADLAEHPVGYFLQPLLQQHDRTAFEVFVYSDVESPDLLTEKIKTNSEHWINILGFSDAALARRIRSDGIDVLIELSGHTAGNRLAVLARRVAPMQLSYLGYPFSTGLTAIDALIGDSVTTPEADAALYRERVLRLPHFPFCMQPHASAPPVAPLPAMQNGYLTFGCFNDLAKLGPGTLKLWSTLLLAIPDARLILRAVGLNDARTCERIASVLASHGVHRARFDLLPPIRPIAAYLDGYALLIRPSEV